MFGMYSTDFVCVYIYIYIYIQQGVHFFNEAIKFPG